MDFNEFQLLAGRTINGDLSKEEQLANMAAGLCGEAGECIDLVKKHLYQGHELDEEKLLEEAGDVLWYLAGLCTVLRTHMEYIAEKNIDKLRRRYPGNGFDAACSINRKED